MNLTEDAKAHLRNLVDLDIARLYGLVLVQALRNPMLAFGVKTPHYKVRIPSGLDLDEEIERAFDLLKMLHGEGSRLEMDLEMDRRPHHPRELRVWGVRPPERPPRRLAVEQIAIADLPEEEQAQVAAAQAYVLELDGLVGKGIHVSMFSTTKGRLDLSFENDNGHGGKLIGITRLVDLDDPWFNGPIRALAPDEVDAKRASDARGP